MAGSSRGSQLAAQMVSIALSPMSALELHYGPTSDIALSPKSAIAEIQSLERHRSKTLRPSPFLECRLNAPPANPRKGPIGRTPGAVGDVFAPGIGPDRIDGLPDDIKGPGRIYLAYHDWLGKMMMSVHHNLEAARRLDSLAVHGLPDGIYVGAARLDNGFRPHPKANEGGFHRVVCDFVALPVEVRPHFDERFVLW